ncbi:hypothetical protein P4S93_18210, partial [Aneurinibacillus thermoaerophilus]|uniref:hypothetical protein n=1 Tax=Aneurinibacillus thermoaerophilus TaxID=143495 RepID=UPI002E2124AE|nr:hypothetical protein [Aneurinibacillus thermoaerophilus]MED0762654.1 hypothetical protein [Aneurinibacillus thermoaerophilus]
AQLQLKTKKIVFFWNENILIPKLQIHIVFFSVFYGFGSIYRMYQTTGLWISTTQYSFRFFLTN